MAGGLLYRIQQFRRAHQDAPTSEGLSQAETLLTPPLFNLFQQLLPFEQAHAIRVMEGLAVQGYDDPELLVAALLHDVGKMHVHLAPWERAMYVAVKQVFPGLAARWGKMPPKGLRRGFVVAAQHARWGAELAEQAGASPLVVEWIARHQDEDFSGMEVHERRLMEALRKVDDRS